LAYDGSPKSEEALFVATYLSVRWDVPLVVVTVIETGRTTSEPLARAQGYLETRGGQATFVKEIVLGSTVDEVLRTSRRPILICR